MKKQYIPFLLAVSIIIIGFGYHSVNSSHINSAHIFLEPDELYVTKIHISKPIVSKTYQFNIRFNIFNINIENQTVVVVNDTEYEKLLRNEKLLNELNPFFQLTQEYKDDSIKYQGSSNQIINTEIEFYLIIKNNHKTLLQSFYYHGFIPISYYQGLFLIIFGFLGLFFYCIYYFKGWIRYFVIGTGPNVLIFLIKISTLGAYNRLNLKSSYFHNLITLELYNDFEFWYLSWMDPLIKGNFPYGDISSTNIFHYQMPPLFILTLIVFYLIPFLPIWKVGIPIFLSHIGTGIVVYYICSELFHNEKRAIQSMLFYYLNPVSLFYAAFGWFNPSIFVFLVITCSFLLLKKRKKIKFFRNYLDNYDVAFIILAIATMYKQFAFVILPLALLYVYITISIENHDLALIFTVRYYLNYFLTILIIIFPFIIIDQDSVFTSTLSQTTIFYVEYTQIICSRCSVNFNTLFVAIGLPSYLTDIIGFLIISWILQISSLVLIYLLFYQERKIIIKLPKEISKLNYLFKNYIFWVIITIISVHLLYPRGTFKFYLLFLIPFFSILLGFQIPKITIDKIIDLKNEENRDSSFNFILAIVLLIGIVLISRNIYFLLLDVLIIILLSKKYNLIRQLN
jgi:hypothetical protein